MFVRTRILAGLAALFALSLAASAADAQGFGDRLKRRAAEAAKRKVEERTEKKAAEATDKALDGAENKVKCAASDKACAEQAAARGQEVETTGSASVTPAGAAAGGRALKPGEGAWANYDFVPGTRPLYVDDFTKDNVGDFPRRLEFKEGALEIVDWNGGRWLRATSQSKFFIMLPENLPSRFTLEFDYIGDYNQAVWVVFDKNSQRRVDLEGNGEVALRNYDTDVNADGRYDASREGNRILRLRVLGDGRYVKVYVNEKRVLNVPNADLPRADRIMVHVDGDEARPTMMTNFSVMAGGRKLYDAIAESGRVATQGIFFDTGSDVIRPESSPTLKEIAQMLTEHADLSLTIEGHTDNVGASAANLALSQKRADAVKAMLVSKYGVDASRLQTKGMGDTKPAAKNDTAEGRQQNRRVELVKS